MGTTFELWLYASDRRRADELFDAAFAEIERIEASLSTYRVTSEISRINSRAGGQPVTTDPETFGLLRRSIDYSRQTEGAFDVTVGRLMRAWGFFRGEGRYPSHPELEQARALTGWHEVELNAAARTVTFRKPELLLDLGAVGKGYALDRVAGLMQSLGVDAVLLGAGESTYVALGAPEGESGWQINIPDPVDRSRTISTVKLRNGALSTSGSYEKFFELEGTTYCHIVDPRTGRPVSDMLQATVVAPSGEASDAAATAVFVGGPAQAAELVAALGADRALLVAGDVAKFELIGINWPGFDTSRQRAPKPVNRNEER